MKGLGLPPPGASSVTVTLLPGKTEEKPLASMSLARRVSVEPSSEVKISLAFWASSVRDRSL